jgi:L-alanine-DL-glutamate epimerase-like enolase superfamily enzyme
VTGARIVGARAIALSRPYERDEQWFTLRFRAIKADCALVVVETDDGMVGVGEACAYGNPRLIGQWIDRLEPSLIGHTVDAAYRVARPTGDSWAYDCAVAGLDCALWDLRGKLAGRRVCDLVAADGPAAVELYASGGCRYDWAGDPTQLIDEVLAYADRGFGTCKIRLGTAWEWEDVDPSRFLRLMEELVGAVEGRLAVAVDANQRLDLRTALEVGRGLDRLGCAWFEEPIPQDDLDGYVRLAAELDLPVTGGEQFTTLARFRPYLERRAFDVVQPDAGWCGLSEALTIAEVAARYDVGLTPHSWHNGAMTLANAHLVASLDRRLPLELSMVQGPLQQGILRGGLEVEDGRLRLPEAPGLGIELAPDLEERFPYVDGDFAVEVQR